MARKSFSVLFFIKKAKLLKNGEAPVCMRITVNGCMVDISIKRSCPVNLWNQAKENSKGKRPYVGGTEPLPRNHTLARTPNL